MQGLPRAASRLLSSAQLSRAPPKGLPLPPHPPQTGPHLLGSNGLVIGAVLHDLSVGQLGVPLLLQGPGEPHPQLMGGARRSVPREPRSPRPPRAPPHLRPHAVGHPGQHQGAELLRAGQGDGNLVPGEVPHVVVVGELQVGLPAQPLGGVLQQLAWAGGAVCACGGGGRATPAACAPRAEDWALGPPPGSHHLSKHLPWHPEQSARALRFHPQTRPTRPPPTRCSGSSSSEHRQNLGSHAPPTTALVQADSLLTGLLVLPCLPRGCPQPRHSSEPLTQIQSPSPASSRPAPSTPAPSHKSTPASGPLHLLLPFLATLTAPLPPSLCSNVSHLPSSPSLFLPPAYICLFTA